MIEYTCNKCHAAMESPECMLGKYEHCPECGAKRRVMLPKPPEPATQRQINFADALGLRFAEGITKTQISELLTTYDRVKHYLFAIWRLLTNRSASSVQHGHAFIRVMTLRLIDEHPDVCEHIYRVVGSDGHSDEFLAVEGELREAIGQCMVSMWQTYSGLPTLPKARI